MKAVKDDLDFELQFPIDSPTPSYKRTIKAKELWNLIVSNATLTAEPGLLMWDTMLKMLPAQSYKDVRI